MFLNDVGQPLVLQPGKNYGPFEQHRGALLLSTAAFKDHVVPEKWCGCVVGSKEDLFRLRSQDNFSAVYLENCTFKTLKPNIPTEIEYDGTSISIMLVPAGKTNDGLDSRIYYIESKPFNWSIFLPELQLNIPFIDGHTRALIVDRLSGYLDFLPKASPSFQNALRLGIDVIYIEEELLDKSAINEDLYAFVHLIKPKNIYGLRQATMPKWLLDLRPIKDLYARP
ncbi:hypothetical protein KR009_006513 [Drosophila setifemur]|nr:hypothetical protein KR009_006513 [Drosophila setifemur]